MEERKTRKKQGTGEGEVSKKLEYVSHPFEPVFDKESRVLIFPEVPGERILLRPPQKPVLAGFGPCTRRAGTSDRGRKARNGAAPPCGVVGCAGWL